MTVYIRGVKISNKILQNKNVIYVSQNYANCFYLAILLLYEKAFLLF